MLTLEEMVLPQGRSLRSVIDSSVQEIARIGASNAKFVTVQVGNQKMVEANPGVKLAWSKRLKKAPE